MPRRETIHNQDATVMCPACRGSGVDASPGSTAATPTEEAASTRGVAPCSLCGGVGRVRDDVAARYHARIAQQAAQPPTSRE